MDAKGHFLCFCLCVGIGFLGGVLYSACSFVRVLFSCPRGKNKAVGAVVDVVFFMAFACFCTLGAYVLRFPALRIYMWVGYAVGLVLYLKSLHKVVAFFQNICYNKITKLIEKAKLQRKTRKRLKANDARKNEKIDNGVRGGRHGVARLFAWRFGLSVDHNRGKRPARKENQR